MKIYFADIENKFVQQRNYLNRKSRFSQKSAINESLNSNNLYRRVSSCSQSNSDYNINAKKNTSENLINFKFKNYVSDSIGSSLKVLGFIRSSGKLSIDDQILKPSVRKRDEK